jgi:hypothetical protein
VTRPRAAVRAWLLAGALAALACTRAPRLPEPVPPETDPQAFHAYMLANLPDTLEKVTCHCCKKTLARCYRDIQEHAPGACPYG